MLLKTFAIFLLISVLLNFFITDYLSFEVIVYTMTTLMILSALKEGTYK